MNKRIVSGLSALVLTLAFNTGALANNLKISDGFVSGVNTVSGTATVQFSVSWDNSWRDNINYDAVWLFMKFSVDGGITWRHATLSASGVNPAGFSEGTGMNMEIFVPLDRKGCFLRRSWIGSGNVITQNVTIAWKYLTDGLSLNEVDNVDLKIFGIEMVYVPAGSFYAGDYEISNACFSQGKNIAETDPWYVQSDAAIFVTNADFNGFYYRSAGNTGESATGDEFIIPDSFPKGYRAFYLMKYEITEDAWADFLNTLTPEQKAQRDITGPDGKNTNAVADRNTISLAGDKVLTGRPDRACGYLSWMDITAYADWSALRPMSELEYEKAARGKDIPALGGEYAWGTTAITGARAISGAEDGAETIATAGANANYGNNSLSGGDGGTGPLRAGIFAGSGTTRSEAGSGYYGAMELSGNLWERVVTVGNVAGRNFQASHGDGILTSYAGYEGNADSSDWPGYVSMRGVSTAEGTGLKGGSYAETAVTLQAVSDRSKAAQVNAARRADAGGRCVRTAE